MFKLIALCAIFIQVDFKLGLFVAVSHYDKSVEKF